MSKVVISTLQKIFKTLRRVTYLDDDSVFFWFPRGFEDIGVEVIVPPTDVCIHFRVYI